MRMYANIAQVMARGAGKAAIIGAFAAHLHLAPRCDPASEKEEMLKLIRAARLPEPIQVDFERNDIAVVELMSMGGGRLSVEPPDGAAVMALLSALSGGSSLTGADKWPDKNGDAGEKAKWTTMGTKLTALCRMAQPLLKAALDSRAIDSGLGLSAPTGDADKKRREENEALRKDAAYRLKTLCKESEHLYNRAFELSEVDAKMLVDTEIAFKSSQLLIGSLQSGKYGAKNAVQATRAKAEIEDGALVVGDDEHTVDLTRNGYVLGQIWNCLESLVVGSCMVEIDPVVSHMAGHYGKVSRMGRDKQLQFDATTQLDCFKSFVLLSGVCAPAMLLSAFSGGLSYITVCRITRTCGHGRHVNVASHSPARECGLFREKVPLFIRRRAR